MGDGSVYYLASLVHTNNDMVILIMSTASLIGVLKDHMFFFFFFLSGDFNFTVVFGKLKSLLNHITFIY